MGKLPLERRRWRLDSIAAGATIPGGGCFPSRLYKSSISFFCSVCRASTSDKCLRIHQEHERWPHALLSRVYLLSFLPRLTSAEDSAAEPRIPHPPHCSRIPHCSGTGCCMSSSSIPGWDGSGVGGCPQLGVPSHRPLPQLQPLGLQLHGHSQPEPLWPPARFQHCPLCLSSPRSAEGLEALGNWKELGMLVAGEEAQLVPWMKSLGNAPQAAAFPL